MSVTTAHLTGVRSAARLALAALLVVLLAACSGGGGAGSGGGDGASAPATGGEGGGSEGGLTISANNLEFDTDTLTAPAGEAFTIEFTNGEAAPHNVAIYTDESRSETLFRGDVISGPDNTVTYDVGELEAGEYYFQCDVHPEMNGTFVVE